MYASVLSRYLKILCLLLSLFGITWQASAQQIYTFSGRVTDAQSGDPVPFASVAFKGKNLGTTTNFEGFYSLKVKILSDSLLVTSMGFQTRAKAIDPKQAGQTINFQLESYAV